MRIAMGVVAVLAFAFLARAVVRWFGPAPEPRGRGAGGVVTLRPPRFLNVALGLTFLPVPLLVGSLAARLANRGQAGVPALVGAGVLVALGLAGSAWLVAAEFRSRVLVTEFAIEHVGVLTRRQTSWTSVTRLVHNPVRRWFFITTAEGRRVWVSEDLRGAGEFAELALARIPAHVLDASPDAREALEELAAEVRALPGSTTDPEEK
jgi:hypothetical protein